ncbi:unnamed protein product [Blepharisma stoltei]|uniref:Clathrin light chain n=1 Tax=Blepharisma stoltei TaxID=1481888 RepID=A0AAU9JIG7_9CILI|nr:unnamed protein product [Blepharisma stoltei]
MSEVLDSFPINDDIFSMPATTTTAGEIAQPPQATSGPFLSTDFVEESAQPSGSSMSSEVDEEENERQRQRDVEQQAFNRKLYLKDEKERTRKDEKRRKAQEELKKWHDDRRQRIQQKMEFNREEEKHSREMKQQLSHGSSWKKVASMINFNDGGERKEVARMKSVLLTKKNED